MPTHRSGKAAVSHEEGFFPLTFTEMVGLLTLVVAIIFLLSRKDAPPPPQRPRGGVDYSSPSRLPPPPLSPLSPHSPGGRYGFRSPVADRYDHF